MESIINFLGWGSLVLIVIVVGYSVYVWVSGWIDNRRQNTFLKWHARIYKEAGEEIKSSSYWMSGQSLVIYELMQWIGDTMIKNGYIPRGDVFREKYHSLIKESGSNEPSEMDLCVEELKSIVDANKELYGVDFSAGMHKVFSMVQGWRLHKKF